MKQKWLKREQRENQTMIMCANMGQLFVVSSERASLDVELCMTRHDLHVSSTKNMEHENERERAREKQMRERARTHKTNKRCNYGKCSIQLLVISIIFNYIASQCVMMVEE